MYSAIAIILQSILPRYQNVEVINLRYLCNNNDDDDHSTLQQIQSYEEGTTYSTIGFCG